MADVIGYEEKDPRVLATFAAGYPRFFRNPLIDRLCRLFAGEGCMHADDPLLPTEAAAHALCEFLGMGEHCVAPVLDVWTVRLHESPALQDRARTFLQHTGCGLSSREAEDILERWFGQRPFNEPRSFAGHDADLRQIRSHLHHVYGSAAETDIHIFRSGMNAFQAGYRAIQATQLDRGRDIWIQLGWIYVDTVRILQKFSLPGAAPVRVLNVADLADLKEVLVDCGHRVAGIVTEVPTNPLVQTPDIERLRALADRHGAALVLDPSLVSPHNVNVLRYADVHINSLTKYAAAEGDVMMGALALNADSAFYDDLAPLVGALGIPPASGDLARMAVEIRQYPATIRAINANTAEVAAFLAGHPGVAEVHWARAEATGYHYTWLQHLEAGPGAIVTFVPKKPLDRFYDPSRIAKSPSFGTRFSMMCPFMYLAHYDLASTDPGRALLREQGIHPDLVRLSVGCEPAGEIIAELDRTL
jgi:cystathionine gamma-synthase